MEPVHDPEVSSSEPVRGAVQALLRQASDALVRRDWKAALLLAQTALRLDPDSESARRFEAVAKRRLERPATVRPQALERGSASIEAVLGRVRDLIAMPSVGQRVLQVADDDTSTIDDLIRVVGSDAGLSASILRLANAARFWRLRGVGTVREAILLLGLEEVRSIALAASYMRSAPAPRVLDNEEFWRFSLMVGTLADLQSRVHRVARGHAFTAGVIHSIGLLALDVAEPVKLQLALSQREPTLLRLSDRVRHVIGFTPGELGARLARSWGFPDDLTSAIEHHDARAAERQLLPPLAGYVVSARILLRSQGFSDGAERNEPKPMPAEWLTPPLSTALEQLGGLKEISDRMNHFLEALPAAA